MPSLCQILLAELVVLGMLLSVSSAQNFHFSNGWKPGKRSHTEDSCSFRPQIKVLIMRIIEDEVQRMMKCGSSGYNDLMTLIQRSDKRSELPLTPAVIADGN